MGWLEANQGPVLPKMAEASEEYVSFLGYILTSYSFAVGVGFLTTASSLLDEDSGQGCTSGPDLRKAC